MDENELTGLTFPNLKIKEKETKNKNGLVQEIRKKSQSPNTRQCILSTREKLIVAANYDLRKYSFCNRITNVWNNLPEDYCYYLIS